MVHAHSDDGGRNAVLAGASSIEHGTFLSTETLTLMKERGTWFVPTFVTTYEMTEERNHPVLRLRGMHMIPQLEMVVREAYAIGTGIVAGADGNYHSESTNRISIEVAHYVRLGMNNFDALQTAMVNSAQLLGLEDQTGRIAEGYEADLIVVPANPLTRIEALQDVLMVMSNGQVALKRFPFDGTQ